MATTKFTPGPWEAMKGAGWYVTRPDAIVRREAALAVGTSPAHTIVTSPAPAVPPWFEDEEARANAYLMAASPDLYEALDEIAMTPGVVLPKWLLDIALAALAKAVR